MMKAEQVLPFIPANPLLGDPAALARAMRDDGFLFFKGLFPREAVLGLRKAILDICSKMDWLKPGTDPMLGLCGHAPVAESGPDWARFYEQVQRLERFHRLAYDHAPKSVLDALFEEECFCLPAKIARLAFPGQEDKAVFAHQDYVYVQGSVDTVTCWVALGDLPGELGGLIVKPGSHKGGVQIPKKGQDGGHVFWSDPELPWYGTDYQAGDAVIFHSLTLHAGRPNTSIDRLRLSMDFRYCGLNHSVSEENRRPHSPRGRSLSWDQLDADWDPNFRRYWERLPVRWTTPQPYLFS
jgi:hypothetical protein